MPEEPAVADSGATTSGAAVPGSEQRAPRTSTIAGIRVAAALCIALGIYSAALAFSGIFLGFVSDSCGESGACSITGITVAVFIGLLGPPLVAIVAIIVAIVRGRRRRAFTWIIPLAGGLLATVVAIAATALAFSSAGIDFFTQQ